MSTERKSRIAAHHDYIVEALAAGTSQRNIAKTLGFSTGTLSDYMARHGLASQPRATAQYTPAETDGVSREQILEEQVKELRTRLNKTTKADVNEERVLQAIEQAVAATPPPAEVLIPSVEATGDAQVQEALDYYAFHNGGDPGRPEAHHRQVLLLSDFHGGEVVEAEAVGYHNAYSWEIMEQRVDELIAATLSHKRNSPALTGLDVLFIGDMCSGSNHQELAETNEFPLAEQAVRMGYLQADIIRRLNPHYDSIRVGVVVGNHPRLPHKPAAKRVYDNGDWIAGTIMSESLKQYPNVAVTVPRAASLLWRVAGRTMYVWHGDGIRSSMPGVPWGGVMRRVNAIDSRQAQRIDHFVCGHYHQANVVGSGRIIMNGALKGTDEWVEKSFGGGDKPTQLLLTFDEKHERMTDVRYITPTAGLPA
jgi:transposase